MFVHFLHWGGDQVVLTVDGGVVVVGDAVGDVGEMMKMTVKVVEPPYLVARLVTTVT